MKQILKRLELIKTAMSINDEEIIELQIMKLDKLTLDDEVEAILIKLEKLDYGSVVVDIESYLLKYSDVVVYEDKELVDLRLELKALENKLQELSEQKNEYLNDIDEFNVQYYLHLGSLIQKILNLKEGLLFASMQKLKDTFDEMKNEYESCKRERDYLKNQKEEKEKELNNLDEFDDAYEKLYEELQELKGVLEDKEKKLNEKRKETKQAKRTFEEDELKQEYEDVKQDSEEFNKGYEEIQSKDRLEIRDEEKRELKQLFRKVSKLCNPDIVSHELKEQADEIMQEVYEAYSERNIQAVQEIFTSLQSAKYFDVGSDSIDNKDLLKSKIIDIRDTIEININEIKIIKEGDGMQIINDYDDFDKYFHRIEEELKSEYERLKVSS